MKKKYSSLSSLIKAELSTKEHEGTHKLIKKFRDVKKRGFFTLAEFLEMGRWKSHRTKKQCARNTSKKVIRVSKEVFAAKDEAVKLEALTKLHGVAVPTASAILMLLDPKRYGTIDIRVWEVLHLYGAVSEKPRGIGLGIKEWAIYTDFLRRYAKKFKVKARDIERTVFKHHKRIQEGILYK